MLVSWGGQPWQVETRLHESLSCDLDQEPEGNCHDFYGICGASRAITPCIDRWGSMSYSQHVSLVVSMLPVEMLDRGIDIRVAVGFVMISSMLAGHRQACPS